jgi:GNAT superfamily N-acetyltransferase
VSVRPARAEDAAEIARVQAVTWRTAYRSLLPAQVLDEWDDDAAAAVWLAAATRPPTPGHGMLVALERQGLAAEGLTQEGLKREGIVGFAAYGPAELAAGEPPSPDGPTTELATLLVEPRWGRRGHGSRLLAGVSDLVRATGARRLQVWLLEADRISASFFESAGWAPDGWARTLDTGAEPLREVRWHTLLDQEPMPA